MKSFAILVNTTDSFEDCWHPFFKLFKKYWPEFHGKLYLNTEEKVFSFPGLNIISIQNKQKGKSWSQCLRTALAFINEDTILYLQEDYFFCNEVNSQLVDKFCQIAIENEFDCLHLTDQSTGGPYNNNTVSHDIWEIKKNAPYRLSTQAALWKKNSLQLLLRDWENAWQFELYGSQRSDLLLNKIMVVRTDRYGVNKSEILPYIFTGIIKGKWKDEVPTLFLKHNIVMDYSLRGVENNSFKPKNGVLKKLKTARSLLSVLKSHIELISLRLWRN